jgi:hypothetical protein
MRYNKLPLADRAAIDHLLTLLRPAAAEMARAVTVAEMIAATHNTSCIDALAALGAADKIPNKTDLAGAQPLTASEVDKLVMQVAGVVTAFDSTENLELYVKAAGVNSVSK